MLDHIAMKNPPPVMRNDEETIENPKRQSRDGEEVHRRNRLSMVIQECDPSLRSGFLGAFRIQHNTVLSEISSPSIVSSP